MQKTCAGCKEFKLINQFGLDKNRSDGRAPYCKDCRHIISHKLYEKHKEKILRSQKLKKLNKPASVTFRDIYIEKARDAIRKNPSLCNSTIAKIAGATYNFICRERKKMKRRCTINTKN